MRSLLLLLGLSLGCWAQYIPVGFNSGPGGGGVSFTFIQSKPATGDANTVCTSSGSAGATTQTCTFNSGVGSGNLVVVSAGTYNTTISASDNQGNTYTCNNQSNSSDNTDAASCWAIASTTCGTASCFTVTMTTGVASYRVMHIYEFHRSSGTWTSDVVGSNTGSGASETVSTGSNTTGNPDLIFANFAFQTNHTSDTAGSGYTLLDTNTTTSTVVIGLTDEWPTTAPNAGAQTATITPSNSTVYAARIQSFK